MAFIVIVFCNSINIIRKYRRHLYQFSKDLLVKAAIVKALLNMSKKNKCLDIQSKCKGLFMPLYQCAFGGAGEE